MREKLAEFGYLPESDIAYGGEGYLEGLDGGGEGDEDAVDSQEVAEAIASLRGETFGGAPVGLGDEEGVEGEPVGGALREQGQ